MARCAALDFLYTSPDQCPCDSARVLREEYIQAVNLTSALIVASGRARVCLQGNKAQRSEPFLVNTLSSVRLRRLKFALGVAVEKLLQLS